MKDNEGVTIPYKSIDELPDNFKDVPTKGKEIAMAAFNSAFSGTCKDQKDPEACAMKIAWSAIGNKFEKDKDGKWQEKKAEDTQSIIRSSLQPPTERPKIENGIWIPFLRDNMLADVTGKDGRVTRYRITKQAIDNGYKSFLGKTFDGNHERDIPGKIIDVKREGELAFFKAEGLSEDTLAVMNSVAYNGVSQSSRNLKSIVDGGENKVLELDGLKIAIITWPHTPGCPIESGCGLPLASSVKDTHNFSLYSSQNNGEVIKSIAGDTTVEYTKEDIKAMLKTMTEKPDMVDESMKKMMQEMAGAEPAKEEKKEEMTKSTVKADVTNTISSLNTDKEIKETNENQNTGGLKSTMANEFTPEQIKDITADWVAHPEKIPAELRSTLDKTVTPKDLNDLATSNTMVMKSTLDQMKIEMAVKQEQKEARDKVITELYSCVKRSVVDDLVKRNVSTEVLQSNLNFARDMGINMPGAGVGTEAILNSTVGQLKSQYIEGEEIFRKLGVSEEEFIKSGGK